MGADMMLAMARSPHPADGINPLSTETLVQVTTKRLDRIDWQEMAASLLCEEAPGAPTAELRKLADEAAAALLQPRRDVTEITIENHAYLVSGGMSYGDAPTDAFDLIDLVDQLGVWEEAITEEELLTPPSRSDGR